MLASAGSGWTDHEATRMRGDTDGGDLKACLKSIASLINHANERAKDSVQAAEAGHIERSINIAVEVELLLDEATQRLTVAFDINKQSIEILDIAGNTKGPLFP
jgi:hypothetical protein